MKPVRTDNYSRPAVTAPDLCVMFTPVTNDKDYFTFDPANTRGAWYLSRDLCGEG